MVTVAGSESATVRLRNHLRVIITGSGSVYYLGDPGVEVSITGTGRVLRLEGRVRSG